MHPPEPGHAAEVAFQIRVAGVVPDRLVGAVVILEIGEQDRVIPAAGVHDLLQLGFDLVRQHLRRRC